MLTFGEEWSDRGDVFDYLLKPIFSRTSPQSSGLYHNESEDFAYDRFDRMKYILRGDER